MTDQPKDGGPAFPCRLFQRGFTLRDYFAGRAMQGEVATNDEKSSAEMIANWAYAQADAMLAERAKGDTP